jgi:hypothetical protein
MKERRLLYFALGALAAVSIGAVAVHDEGIQFPDGTVQTTAAQNSLRMRGFFLTQSGYSAPDAPTACGQNFHFASLWELFDVSNLAYVYQSPLALTSADSGQGPPSVTDSFTMAEGWVRTGFPSETTLGPGRSNCGAWSTTIDWTEGTTAQLNYYWTPGVYPSVYGPWEISTRSCHLTARVWCVEDVKTGCAVCHS